MAASSSVLTTEKSFAPHGPQKTGLVLSGGGARGAYQAGALKAITDIVSGASSQNPIPIITGVSAGAINAAYLASAAHDFANATDRLAMIWSRITADQVFKTDVFSAGRSGVRLMADAAFGALYEKKLARALLDTAPLHRLLSETIDFEKIPANIRAGHLDSFAITAVDYSDSHSVTFVSAPEKTHLWSRTRRRAELTEINVSHVMGSAAIPLFFPPARIGDDHYGDGCLRNTAPLSPAIHLGADKLLVISVRRPENKAAPPESDVEPSVARILGVILNALLLDAVDIDMERLSRVNQTVASIPEKQLEDLQLRKIDYLWLRPSIDIGHLAGELFEHLPRVIRYLMGGLGTSREASELTSYLLFHPDFCGRLVRLGYEDAMNNRQAIEDFLR